MNSIFRLTPPPGVASLAESNPEAEFTLGHDWPSAALETVPDDVATEDLSALGSE